MKITYKYKDKPTIIWLMISGFGSLLTAIISIRALLSAEELIIKMFSVVLFVGLSSILALAFFRDYIARKKELIKENDYYVDLPKDAFDIKIDGKKLK